MSQATLPRRLPDHGTLHRRKIHGCGCSACRKCENDYMTRRTRLMAYGRWQPFVDADPVRAHVRMLMSYGIGWQRVAALAGVSSGCVSRILYSDGSRNRGPSKRVRVATADKLLAVRPSFEHLASSTRVDGTGTRRRLRALVAVGWPQLEIGAQLGIDRRACWHLLHRDQVEAATVRAVRDLYDRLWNVAPATAGIPPLSIARALAVAARHRWAPPGAWDDDTIDSPAATPDLGERADRYEAIREDAEWLMTEHGYDREGAARRLGITRRHLDRAFAAEAVEAAS